ncbi:MAG: ANTAR domain-containing protein [Jatrophihabitans sp.]|uniref:ANTAR domain-containing protein n=1 Tax=Jatrophihabitans sp. TaxID=1932789 RepID=UPI003F81A91C
MTTTADVGAAITALAALTADADADAVTTARAIMMTATTVLPGCSWASTTQDIKGQFVTTAASDDVAVQVDGFQYAAGEGPCITALRWKRGLEVDLETDKRWPDFTTAAIMQTPVRFVVSRPLLVDGLPAGSVNFYGASAELVEAGAAIDLVTGVVALAMVAMTQRDRVGHLRKALDSRERISAAVGIVMASERLTYDDAFQRLVATSQHRHRKLREVAEDVLLTGVLPRS